eukprot:15468243-Alexandrium_andersonii.AAC.1
MNDCDSETGTKDKGACDSSHCRGDPGSDGADGRFTASQRCEATWVIESERNDVSHNNEVSDSLMHLAVPNS